MEDSSPTSRALRTLELLQRMPGISAEQLAARLGVTDRAARRYVAILRESGIRVESSRGPHGGYRIGRSVRPPPLIFTSAAALALVIAVLDAQHAPARPDPALTSDLAAAAAAHRRTRIGYRSASGRAYHTDVDPWAVVARFGVWYLLCFSHDAHAVRTLRIDRISAVEPSADEFQPPQDLDAVALLERHLGTGWPYRVKLIFHAPFADVAPWVSAPAGQLTPIDDGAGCMLLGSTNNPDGYGGERLAAIPYPVTVEEGPELRAAVDRLATRLGNAVSRDPRAGPGTAR